MIAAEETGSRERGCGGDTPVPNEALQAWVSDARAKVAKGTFSLGDLDCLEGLLSAAVEPGTRQRLLYLHAREPSVTAEVIAWAEHPSEDPGGLPPARPYPTVLAAIADGWRAIQFPQQLAPFDDRETDLVGCEFILEKLEPVS